MSLDEDLAALHRHGSVPAGRAACPSADELFSLAAGEATPPAQERLVDHVAGCTACAEEVRLMRSLQPWAEEVAQRLESPELAGTGRHALRAKGPVPLGGGGLEKGEGQDGGGRRLRVGLPLAAALVAAVIGAGILLQRDVVAPPGSAVLRGATFERVSPASDAVLQQPPPELVWPAQAGATGYRLQLFDEAANLLWESTALRAPKGALPPGVRARLLPGASYFWTVDVEGQARRHRLGPYWFRLG